MALPADLVRVAAKVKGGLPSLDGGRFWRQFRVTNVGAYYNTGLEICETTDARTKSALIVMMMLGYIGLGTSLTCRRGPPRVS
jgi:hypothetical protein